MTLPPPEVYQQIFASWVLFGAPDWTEAKKLDDLCHAAGELGLLGVPAFMFQEGDDPIAEQAFREIARLTRGAYCRFDPGAAHQLAELLRAVAAYAAGGVKALAAVQHSAGAARLLLQLR
jgi:hypothetical protein